MDIPPAEAAEGDEETRQEVRCITQNLVAHTVLVGKWMNQREARDPENALRSLRGTGILIRNGSAEGILTAGHVVRDLVRGGLPEEAVMAVDQSSIPMATGLQRPRRMQVRGWIVAGEGTRISHEDPRETQLRGPDIAWIRVTAEDARTLERYGSTFHNWERSENARDEEMRQQGRGKVGLWACGRIHEKSRKLLGTDKLMLCVVARQVFRESRVQEPRDGWDRFDYALELDDNAEVGYADWGQAERNAAVKEILHEEPASWGGMSGGGIWAAHKRQVDDRPQCSLVGVVYAEHSPSSDKPELKLRAHGIGSINRVLGRE